MSIVLNEYEWAEHMFRPLQSSSTLGSTANSDGKGATDEGGAPPKDVDELSESGEQNREDA